MSSLHSSKYLFDPRPNYPMLVCVKQYYDPKTRCTDPNALTLIAVHGSGHTKEIWEPCLDDLFVLVKSKGLKVNDVWSIELPSHGETAAMNAKVVEWCYRPVFRSEDISRAIHAVVMHLGTGMDVDLSKRRLVGIGHSIGALGMLLTPNFYPSIPWDSLIAIEAVVRPPSAFTSKMQNFLVTNSERQVDTWLSLAEARRTMLQKSTWKIWDTRCFETYIKYALKPVNSEDPEGPVTLKTSKMDAAATQRDPQGIRLSYLNLSGLAKRVPTHLIYGAVPDLLDEAGRNETINVTSGGRDKLASVKVIVTHPRELASAIFDALQIDAHSSAPLAKGRL